MNAIGFDFGTTNSTISFYNQETKTLDCFQMNIVKYYVTLEITDVKAVIFNVYYREFIAERSFSC